MTEQGTQRRRGAHRSIEILHELADARLGATGLARAGRAVSELNWQPAQAHAIQRDDFRDVWHAGHVSALVSNGVDVVAAAQTGGVWLLTSVTAPSPLAGYTSTPLSDTWDAPDVSCLTFGPDPDQVYAGTGAGALMLMEFGTALGGHLVHLRTTTIPVPFTSTRAIVTMADPRRIVVMTSRGVWSSPVPVPAANLAGYDWQEAAGLPPAVYTGLAAGPGQSVAVAHSGDRLITGIGTPPAPAAFYRGRFGTGGLTFEEAGVTGLDVTLMGRISLASCDDQRSRMYAVAEQAAAQTILGVLASSDGGATWQSTGSPDPAKAGMQGFYNNAIVVSPQRPDVVVIAWLSGGPFWSFDGGATWAQQHNQETNPHLHNDLHAVFLGRNGAGPEPLYVGGDGGIVVSNDLGRTYHSQFNRSLNDLQFYGGARASFVGSFGGSLTASSRYPGLLAGGTQDNGNIYRPPDRRRTGVPRQADMAWLRHVGGDGDLNRFVDPLGVLLNFDNTNTKLGMAVWDEDSQRFPRGPGAVIAADDQPGGVSPSAVELVVRPTHRVNGKLVYAVVGSLPTGDVHGLIAADPRGDKPDARDVSLVRLGSVGAPVSALGTHDGTTVMVGTTTGRILALDSASGTKTEYAVPDIAGGVVSRIEVFPAPSRLGALPDNAYALMGDGILHFNGLFWATTTGSGWTTFTYDRSTDRLFGATDADVFVSADHGRTWVDASAGLPARPHCADLRIAADGNGGFDLYLSTYGRSVWRATIARRPEIFELPPEAVEILVGVIEDGGGIVRVGGRIIKIPPRPLIRDILAALVVEDVAQGMSPSSAASSAEIRAIALRQIAAIAARAAEELR